MLRDTMKLAVVVGIGGVCRRDGRVLLVRRGKEPFRGRWTIPGGTLEFGERIAQALIREMKEETGLDVAVGDLAGITEAIDPGGEYHFVLFDYFVSIVGGDLVAGDDVTEAGWFSLEQVRELEATPGLFKFLGRL